VPFVSRKDQRERDQSYSPEKFPTEVAEESTYLEMFRGSRDLFIDENLSTSYMLNVGNYNERKKTVRSLIEEGIVNRKKYESYTGEFDYDRMANDLDQNPDTKGLVQTDLQLFSERSQMLKERREETQKTLAAGSGFKKGLAVALGSIVGSGYDPAVLATLPFATSVQTLKGLSTLGRALVVGRNEFALAAASETFIQPLVYSHKESIGSPYEVEDALLAIATVAIGAGVLGATADAGINGLSGYFKSVREKASPFVSKPSKDKLIGVDGEAAQRAVTPEEESLEILLRLEEDLNAQRTARPTDTETREYNKFRKGEYTGLAQTKEATIKGLNKDVASFSKEEPTFARWIAENGGLNRDRFAREGVDLADMAIAGGFGKPVFRKTGGMGPDELAEKLVEINRIQSFDSNEALDLVVDMVSNPSKRFSQEADIYLSDLNARISRLESTEDDLLETVYHDAIKQDIEADIDILRTSQQRLDEFNDSNPAYSDYVDAFPESVAPRGTVTSQQRDILDAEGLAKNYDDDMAAFNALETRNVFDEFDEFVDGDEYMKRIDDEIEGLESVTRCAIG
jgi:hypothetical protein